MYLLLVSTLTCFFDALSPAFVKYVTICIYARRKYDTELRNCLVSLRQEMAGLSMMDDFSKYAKLQRKCNKLEENLKRNAGDRLTSRLKLQATMIYAFRMLNGLLTAMLLYSYRSHPVITLPEGILWPLNGILSWPNGYCDCISLVMWLLISRLVMSSVKKSSFA